MRNEQVIPRRLCSSQRVKQTPRHPRRHARPQAFVDLTADLQIMSQIAEKTVARLFHPGYTTVFILGNQSRADVERRRVQNPDAVDDAPFARAASKIDVQ